MPIDIRPPGERPDPERPYAREVWSRLPPVLEEERWAVVATIEQCEREGWSVDDCVALCLVLEHVSPDLDEAVALRRMAELREKYSKPW